MTFQPDRMSETTALLQSKSTDVGVCISDVWIIMCHFTSVDVYGCALFDHFIHSLLVKASDTHRVL